MMYMIYDIYICIFIGDMKTETPKVPVKVIGNQEKEERPPLSAIVNTKTKKKTKAMKVKIGKKEERKKRSPRPQIYIPSTKHTPLRPPTYQATKHYSNPDLGPQCRNPTLAYSISTANVVRCREQEAKRKCRGH